MAFSTLVNFGVINFVVFERGFRNPKITLVLGILAYVGLLFIYTSGLNLIPGGRSKNGCYINHCRYAGRVYAEFKL